MFSNKLLFLIKILVVFLKYFVVYSFSTMDYKNKDLVYLRKAIERKLLRTKATSPISDLLYQMT